RPSRIDQRLPTDHARASTRGLRAFANRNTTRGGHRTARQAAHHHLSDRVALAAQTLTGDVSRARFARAGVKVKGAFCREIRNFSRKIALTSRRHARHTLRGHSLGSARSRRLLVEELE